MEDNNITRELEILKRDYAVLKETLDKQQIINESRLVDAVKGNATFFDRARAIEMTCALVAIACCPSFHYGFGADWWFVVLTDVMMLVCIVFAAYLYGRVNSRKIICLSLKEYASRVTKFRHAMLVWERAGYGVVAVWMLLLIWQIISHSSGGREEVAFVIAMVFSGLLGLVLGKRLNRQVRNTCDVILSQIEE